MTCFSIQNHTPQVLSALGHQVCCFQNWNEEKKYIRLETWGTTKAILQSPEYIGQYSSHIVYIYIYTKLTINYIVAKSFSCPILSCYGIRNLQFEETFERIYRIEQNRYLSIGKVVKGPSTGIVPQSSLLETSLHILKILIN